MRKFSHQFFTWSQSIKGKQEVISRNTIDNSPIEGFIRNWQTQNKNIICHKYKGGVPGPDAPKMQALPKLG